MSSLKLQTACLLLIFTKYSIITAILKYKRLNASLNDSEPFLGTSKKINETSIDKEFEEFMAIDFEEISEQEEEVNENFEELPFEEKLKIKTSIQDPPTDLELKPLPKHLEYAFLEKDSIFPVVISALLKDEEKKRLVSVLKNHKEDFAWKTSNIPGISHLFENIKSTLKTMRNPSLKDNVDLTQIRKKL
ncbi:hypothetical protein Tco_1090052 [Tanacetum coccineum]|uniref:Reverse transcriptase domain-containing protein n=1 Tax=Tanacetum coccineum TaxID=301880 RepID=A0ABQ5I409_9ASTR